MAKYKEWLTEESLLLIRGWARDGMTNLEIAGKMGISEETFYKWQREHAEFSEALKKGKEVIDREVEEALNKKTLGYTVKVQKQVKLKRSIYEGGKKVMEEEYLEPCIEEVYIPPDTTAQIFWLKNRKPKDWRDKQEIESTVDTNFTFTFEDFEDEELMG